MGRAKKVNGVVSASVIWHGMDLTTNSSGSVLAVDFSTLNSLMADGKKNILVAFYEPGCYHSQQFVLVDPAPIEALSARLKENDANVKVVKFDAEANVVPQQFDLQYVPTVFHISRTG